MSEIDVSKCEYYNDYYKTCSNFSRFSDDEPYCDPKEFKCSYYINNIEQQFQQLKAENKELKKKKEENTTFYLKKYANKDSECLELQHKINVLKQTLTEIKEIMKKHCRKCKKHKLYHFKLCCTCKYTDILQKISECEVEDA